MDRISHLMIVFIMAIIMTSVAYALVVSPYVKDKEAARTTQAVSRYNDSLDKGYKLYFNGKTASSDGIDINKKNINDYDIKYDDEKKIVRVSKKESESIHPVFVPIFFH